ncbi:hypothetical protein ES705_24088 [subsurface metagenome]
MPELTQKQWEEFQEFKEDYQENETKRNLLLQRQNDILEGGIRSANLKEYRNTYVINAQDSLDSTYPMLVHFNIISGMVRIVSIKLSFWFLNFRSYSKAGAAAGTPSGGGATSGSKTTPSGGGATSGGQGSASGGGATSGSGGGQTSSSGGGQTTSSKTTPSGGGNTTGYKGSASGGADTSGAGGADTRSSAASLTADTTTQILGTVAHDGGYLITSKVDHTSSGRYHTHTVSILNHYHTTPNHTHPNHYHTTPDHTHPSHTHTVANHTHTVANHTHTTPNHTHPNHYHTTPNHTHPSHTHTTPNHTHPNHTHGAVYGIFEEGTSPTIVPSISRDNGKTYGLPMGSYSKSQENLDITALINNAGSKIIKFESDKRARISVQIEIKLDIRAR